MPRLKALPFPWADPAELGTRYASKKGTFDLQEVTLENLPQMLAKFAADRGGLDNEATQSEAMFVMGAPFGDQGFYQLSIRPQIMWIGVANATARLSRDGEGTPFNTVEDALRSILAWIRDARIQHGKIFYTSNAIGRLRWMADTIHTWYARNDR